VTGQTVVLRERPIPLLLCPPQIEQELTWMGPGLQSERLIINCLSRGTVLCMIFLHVYHFHRKNRNVKQHIYTKLKYTVSDLVITPKALISSALENNKALLCLWEN